MATYYNPEEPQYGVTQGFGMNPGGVNPAGGHTGRDKGTPVGSKWRAPADCRVMFEGFPQTMDGSDNPWLLTKGGGLCIVLDSLDGAQTFIAGHLNATHVSKGDIVRQGQHVADTGNTGLWTTGAHVHTECMPDGYNLRNGTYGRINPDIVFKGFYAEEPPLSPNMRKNGEYVTNQRSKPEVVGMAGQPGNNIVREIPPGSREVFEGYVHGQELTVDGIRTDVWYQDKIGFAWAGNFLQVTTDGLPNLTPRKTLLPNERLVIEAGAVQRKDPKVAEDNIIRYIAGNTVEIFTGYVHGENVNGNDIWFVDAKGFAWSGNFVDHGVVGLPDLTVVTPPPPPVKPPVFTEPHLNGLDVSVYQEKASLNLLLGDFIFIKASEGGGGWDDDALASNVAEARLGGKRVGFYHFARPNASEGNTAAEELRSFLSVIKPHLRKGDLIALDWEAENQHLTDWALEWLRGAQAATGATPFIYLNADGINGSEQHAHDWSVVEREFPLWFAGGRDFGQTMDGYIPRGKDQTLTTWEAGVRMFQYTSRGRLPGYDGDLDFNVFYGDLNELDALGATRVLEEPDDDDDPLFPPPPGITEEQMAEIIEKYNEWLKDRFLEEQGE